jgi:hypothetical protein
VAAAALPRISGAFLGRKSRSARTLVDVTRRALTEIANSCGSLPRADAPSRLEML